MAVMWTLTDYFIKIACDIHLEHVFLPKFGLWRTPAPKSRQISFRLIGYHNLAQTVLRQGIKQI